MADTHQGACWKAEDAREILATEALEGQTAVFLATHFPIQDFEIAGARRSEIESPTETALLEVLAAPATRHAFCVVEGEPGSGKSHLIRWLRVKWPFEDDLVLLIQRADGSLEGTLRQLQQKLPPEHQHLFDYVGRPQEITLAGRSRVFQSNLAEAMRADFFEKPLPDAEWCDRNGLFGLLKACGEWTAPERILTVLSGKQGARDQELALFDLDDVSELEQRARALAGGLPTAALRFTRRLRDEAAGIRVRISQEKRDPAMQEALRAEYPHSCGLVDALNLRLESALQSMLGISSEGLKELFLRLRRALGNRRLVLLLEDITAWQGVDSTLIDVLVANEKTREDADLCPMVSVVGITPEYFRNAGFHSNYRDRITHKIRLGQESQMHQYQDVASLRTFDAQIAFAAQYLRAVRTGVEQLVAWSGNGGSVPNTCYDCARRPECHATFGQHEGIGLFPYTGHALVRLFAALEDREHRATYQTPRGMIQGVLWPTLRHPSILDSGEYPGHEVESAWIADDRRRLSGIASSILQAQVPDDAERERMRRLVAYWGSDSEMETRADETGALTYAGIARDIYGAFGLPWLGGEQAESPGPTAPSPVPPIEAPAEMPSRAPLGPTGEERNRPAGATRTPSTRSDTPRPRPVPRSELVRLQTDIAAWREGRPPENPLRLNQLALEIVSKIPWRQLGIPEWVWDRLITQNTVILKGTGQARAPHFVIPREEWAGQGLDAYAALKLGGDNPGDTAQEAYLRQYAVLNRRLAALLESHVRNRLPSLPKGKPWPITATVAQVLLVRCWLRGTVSPLTPVWEQWRNLIKDEGEVSSNPQDRVESWNGVVNATKDSHRKLRDLLRQLVSLPQGDAGRQSLSDAGAVATAVRSLSSTMQLSPFPEQPEGTGQQLSELALLAENAMLIKQKQLPRIPVWEVDRLKGQAEAVDRMTRGLSLREHIQRVDGVVQSVAASLPSAAPAAVQAWNKAKQMLAAQGYLEGGVNTAGKAVEDFLDLVADGNHPSSDTDRLQSLAWALQAPASALRSVHDGFLVGENTVEGLLAYVEQFLGNTGVSTGSLDVVHAAGQRIQTAAERALRELEAVADA